jgi:hypothetical protein
MKFKMGHMASIEQWCETRPDAVSASGQRAQSSFLSLMALSLRVGYKYVFGQFGELALGHLDSITSS